MKSIHAAILALSLGAFGSVSAIAQTGNTNYGSGTLSHNTTGYYDTAIGYRALFDNTIGYDNTATGFESLRYNTTGHFNTAIGDSALFNNTTGYENTATGIFSLLANTTGNYNSACGAYALVENTTGSGNTAVGDDALLGNATGNGNIGIGEEALYTVTSGSNNIGIGFNAGAFLLVNESDNIDIANFGASGDNGIIRIGSTAQKAFYAAGIYGVGVSDGVQVVVNSNGQLGIVNSSIRFKEDVHDMAAASDGLMRLRPVTYRYKQPYADGTKPVDYGLIAEEVAEVYPDLVARDSSGQIRTVQYQKLTPMLLNEVQKERKLLEEQERTIQLLEKRLTALEAAQSAAPADTSIARK